MWGNIRSYDYVGGGVVYQSHHSWPYSSKRAVAEYQKTLYTSPGSYPSSTKSRSFLPKPNSYSIINNTGTPYCIPHGLVLVIVLKD